MSNWVAIPLGLVMFVLAVLLMVWWRQQSFRWPLAVMAGLALGPALSWASGRAFVVPDYRAGCDGLCLGFQGAPVSFFLGESAGGAFRPGMFAVNALIYLAAVLAWMGIVRTVLRGIEPGRGRGWIRTLVASVLVVGPFALAPLYVPAPEAHVRGDSLRIAINARREVYLYDGQAKAPVLRSGLEDVRPRPDGQSGMRVCLRIYTYFYAPAGHMYLDMTPEGVHSNAGAVVPIEQSCWE